MFVATLRLSCENRSFSLRKGSYMVYIRFQTVETGKKAKQMVDD